jgi:hypothetical protein
MRFQEQRTLEFLLVYHNIINMQSNELTLLSLFLTYAVCLLTHHITWEAQICSCESESFLDLLNSNNQDRTPEPIFEFQKKASLMKRRHLNLNLNIKRTGKVSRQLSELDCIETSNRCFDNIYWNQQRSEATGQGIKKMMACFTTENFPMSLKLSWKKHPKNCLLSLQNLLKGRNQASS